MLSEGALPKHPSRVKGETRCSQQLIQPSGFDVSGISLNLPLLTRILPGYAGVALPKQRGPCMLHSSWPLSPPALQPPGAVCSCLEEQTVPCTLAGTQGAWPGHCVALGCCHRANVPLEGWPGQVPTSCPHLSIFRSKMLFSCEKENGGCGRGSWAAVIGQLLPQAVPVQLQPRGPDTSGSQHWDPSQPSSTGNLC